MVKKMLSISSEPTKSFGELLEYANEIANVADFMHCDVMDEEFVERDLLSLDTIKKLNANSLILLDVHLMTRDLKSAYTEFVKAGANILTVHLESFKSPKRLMKVIKTIKKNGALVGISFKPSTPIENVIDFVNMVDLVLVMSVEPGKSGQNFMPETYKKVEYLNDYRKTNNLNFFIEVDGGIVPEIAEKLYSLGANILVSGSYVYNSQDKKIACERLRGENIKNN